MLQVGLNPYGLSYTLGLQGHGTPRANPEGRGLKGFIGIAAELGARTLEIFDPWLADLSEGELPALGERLAALGMTPVISSGLHFGRIDIAIRSGQALGAKVIRVGLSPVLCGDRAAWGDEWPPLVAAIRRRLAELAPQAAAVGLDLAIENHQDFGSRELVALSTPRCWCSRRTDGRVVALAGE